MSRQIAIAETNGSVPAPVRRNVEQSAALMENVVIKGDLSKLTPEERGAYYMAVCKSVGLNPMTKPFEYITLNGRLTLYALRNCTDQLRTIHSVSVVDMTENERDGVYIVTCKVQDASGRTDMAKGAVSIGNMKGEALANALMKAETKSKRRATLSICGLSMLDETEVEDIGNAAGRMNSLPKKDARPVYSKLQAEIDGAKTYDELREWGEGARQRIEVLPYDWQEILRLRYQERIVELRQLGAKPETKAQKVEEPEDAVPSDPEEFMKYVEATLAAVSDPSMLEPTWQYKIEPHIEGLLPPDQEECAGIFRKHERRLS